MKEEQAPGIWTTVPSTLERVRELVGSLPLRTDTIPGDDEPLITSGLLDSMTLFKLYQEIESMAGRTLNPLDIDFQARWNTIAMIAGFLDENKEAT